VRAKRCATRSKKKSSRFELEELTKRKIDRAGAITPKGINSTAQHSTSQHVSQRRTCCWSAVVNNQTNPSNPLRRPLTRMGEQRKLSVCIDHSPLGCVLVGRRVGSLSEEQAVDRVGGSIVECRGLTTPLAGTSVCRWRRA
jgi:hypothetical protein